ncbi:hypothetical protein NDU88_008084 [Pleurodeles waltl]|uniref:Coilin n=1 Tax=Pleurodeles waltl TaxID=8319 RepID=A0AAV7PV83_PLEWA|nr:hypothetical protein NDU88_008084 [Pleurodeles waltl]
MSVPGGGSLRLRLFFDYPPPSTPESCQCWLLLDLSRCRLVTDLSSLIRARFGFSKRSRLSLYLQECLLPPCEAIGVVRDNDCIRVKLEEVVTYEAFESGDSAIWSAGKDSKRATQVWEKGENLHQKKKKKKHDFESSPSKTLHFECSELKKNSKKRKGSSEETRDSSPEGNNVDLNQKKTQKKKNIVQNKAIELDSKNRNVTNITKVKDKKVFDNSVNSKKVNTSKKIKLQVARTGSSSASESDSTSTSSLSSTKKASSKLKPLSNQSQALIKKKDGPQSVSATTETATKDAKVSKSGPSVKPVIGTTGTSSSSSSDSDINKGSGSTLDKKRTQTDSHFTDASLKPQQKKVSANSESSDSSDSGSFVIKKPTPAPSFVGNGDVQITPVLYGPTLNPKGIGRGVARGCGRGHDTAHWRGSGGRGFRGRMRGRGRGNANHFPLDCSTENVKQQLNHSISNVSFIVQNPPETPKRDYSTMPLLAAPPPVGQKIAFKLLELTENYTPEVSEYKEGKVINYNPVTQQLDLEVSSASGAVKIPGKFDLVYESEGGRRTIEYALPQDTKTTQSWSSLIEPRLIVETQPVSEAATNQGNGGPVVLPQQNV